MHYRGADSDVSEIEESAGDESLSGHTGATSRDTTNWCEKNPAAVALGRKGGQKGGRARAESLTASRRTEIAKLAANARWKAKHREDD